MRTRLSSLSIVLLLALAPVAAAEDVIFVVRHAERADAGMQSTMGSGPSDPDLSAAGDARARALASHLRHANVQRVFVSQFKRTRLTAEPLAAALQLEPVVVTASDVQALVGKLGTGKGTALVVGHSDTVPQILQALGVPEKITIGDNEYDNLFIVVRGSDNARLITLKY